MDYHPDHVPPEPIDTVSHDHESLLDDSSYGMSIRPRVFLLNLFRPHVRDYESMNLVLDHLGGFCDNALLEIRFHQSQDLGITSSQISQHYHAQTARADLWRLDQRVNPDLREAVRKFDWAALWNATMEERLRIRHYQHDVEIYGSCRRSGSQRWLIISAAYADPNAYAFGLDILRYLEPLATMQAYHSDFSLAVAQHDVSGEEMHWFSRSFFRHWDQAFQVLQARHPNRYQEDARHILHAFVRQGVNVVDVILKYWYQGSEDDLDDDFGNACERAGRAAVDRQWKAELDSPFASGGPDPLPLSIRTILARADHIRSRKTLFNTAAYLAGTVERENMHREMFVLVLTSLKDWATATGQEGVVDNMMEAIYESEEILGNTISAVVDSDDGPYMWSFHHVTQSPLSNRPLHMYPVVLHYGLPDELPEPVEEVEEGSSQPSDMDQVDWDELTLHLVQPGLIRRFVHRLRSLGAPSYISPWDVELVDIPLEACGPRIAPQTVSHVCKSPQDDICVICLDSYEHDEPASKKSASNKQVKPKNQAFLAQLRHRVVGMRRRQKAGKNKESMQSVQLNSCSHIFHLACLDELLNQAYPKTGFVQCPCCRAEICTARSTRVVRSWVGRIPVVGRLARG